MDPGIQGGGSGVRSPLVSKKAKTYLFAPSLSATKRAFACPHLADFGHTLECFIQLFMEIAVYGALEPRIYMEAALEGMFRNYS